MVKKKAGEPDELTRLRAQGARMREQLEWALTPEYFQQGVQEIDQELAQLRLQAQWRKAEVQKGQWERLIRESQAWWREYRQAFG